MAEDPIEADASNERLAPSEWMGRRSLLLQEMDHETGFWKEQALHSDAAVIDFAKEAIKAAYLMNASAIGLLAIAPATLKFLPTDLIDFSVPFFVGLLNAVICNGSAYFAETHRSAINYFNYVDKYCEVMERYFPGSVTHNPSADKSRLNKLDIRAKAWRWVSIGAAVLSFVAFAYGGYHIIEFWNPGSYP